MRELMFLAHRIPYPPNKGDKIRSWNVLRHLTGRYRVYLGCVIDDPYDHRYESVLQKICTDCHFARLTPTAARLRAVAGLMTGQSLTVRCYRDAGLAQWVDRVLARRRLAGIFVSSSAMAQYGMSPRANGVRRVLDFIDVDSDKWRQYATNRRWPANWLYAHESRALLAFERRAAAAFDANLFVSPAEAELFRKCAPETAAKTLAVRNGVDIDFFSPDSAYEDPYDGEPNVVVFTGAMDYWANVDAVVWFARKVLPAVQWRHPDTRFFIVGANPTVHVKRLTGLPGVYVTGRVVDVRPYLAHASAVVAPLRVARGIQNKVLEAMAMAKGLVATPQALEGIDVVTDTELFVAETAESFAERTSALLGRPETRASLGRHARARVVAAHSWPAALARLDEVLDGV